jgi:hypothetical protein
MSEHDKLERALRTQPGPREEGYHAMELPRSLDETQPRRRSPLARTATLVPAVVAAFLVVSVVGAALSGWSPFGPAGDTPLTSTTSTTVATATGTATPSGEAATCPISDIAMTAAAWDAGAGSRGTIATVSLVDGRAACTISTAVDGVIADASGVSLVQGSSREPARTIVLEPGDAQQVGVAWSNWCAAAPDGPVRLFLRPQGQSSFVEVRYPAGGADPVPPCMGENVPSNLSLTELQPAP